MRRNRSPSSLGLTTHVASARGLARLPAGQGLPLAGCLIAGSLLMGCGRPATEAECERILERAARLELEERLDSSDPKIIDDEVKSTKTAMHDSMMKNCVGKRISESTLRCIDDAATTEELFDGCFR